MNHILKMKKIIKWLLVYLLAPLALAVAVTVPVLLMYVFAYVIQGEGLEPFRQLGEWILEFFDQLYAGLLSLRLENLLSLAELVLGVWLLCIPERVLWELDIQRNRVDKRGHYIRRIRQVLQTHGLEAEEPGAESDRARQEAMQETERLRRQSRTIRVILWILLVMMLWDLAWVWEVYWETYGLYIGVIGLLWRGVQIFLTIYIQRNLPSETRLLEMSLRMQKNEIEQLEGQCSRHHISMDEVWGPVTAQTKGTRGCSHFV
ncbi:MAG: hypothetical protein IJY28_02295 [Clostridia bacterium]|nr:hypothetical protein [Clostridia bacterium]